MKRNYLFFWFAVLFCLAVPTQSFATIYNGSCGESVNWSLDTETGLLKITGSGEMEDYDYEDTPWYSHRSSINKCTIGNSVTSIGDWAFYNCYRLTDITIPNSVTSIGDDAFSDCYRLTSITIPEGVTSIGDYAFDGCTGLTSITIPESVTSIGEYPFRICTGLTSITWNAISCTSFSSSTFYGIEENITSFTFGDKMQTIPARICSGMSNLTNITIPESVTSIGNYAFSDCYRLTDITIPNSVTTIGNDAFKNTLWYRNQPDGEIYVSSCFYKYKGTMPQNSTINIKEGTTCISDEAFYDCSGLTNITIPNSVTFIGGNAFINTPWYKNQPDGEIYVGSCFYKYKGTMPQNSTINIKEGTTCISDEAFKGCSGLTNITIPESVTSIGDNTFSGCSRLTSITIKNGVTRIGSKAFEYCTGLTSITIPEGVTSIGSKAFEYCTGLTSITIPEGVTSIGDYAFDGCTGLTSITIPESVTSIGRAAFSGCTGLNNITIPESVTSIGYYAFSSCSGLTSITISVKNIGWYAFSGCFGLTDITIGNSVRSIGDEAFSGCYNIKNIYCHSQKPPVCIINALYDIDKFDCTLYVPEGKESAYMNAEGWKEFFFIEEITGIDTPRADDGKDTTYNIYDMSGRMVRKAATTTNGLKAGLYIINGRKVLVE